MTFSLSCYYCPDRRQGWKVLLKFIPMLSSTAHAVVVHRLGCKHLSEMFSEYLRSPVAICKNAHSGLVVFWFLNRPQMRKCSILECACNCQIKMYKVSNLSNFSPRLCLIPSICLPLSFAFLCESLFFFLACSLLDFFSHPSPASVLDGKTKMLELGRAFLLGIYVRRCGCVNEQSC